MKTSKRILAVLLAGMMVFTMTACTGVKEEKLLDKYATSDTLGVNYPLGSAFDEFNGYYGVVESNAAVVNDVDVFGSLQYEFLSKEGTNLMQEIKDAQSAGSLTAEQAAQRYVDEVLPQKKVIARVFIFDTASLNSALDSGKKMEDITGYKENYYMVEKVGATYYFCYNDEDTSNLKSQSKGMYKKLRKMIIETKEDLLVFGIKFVGPFRAQVGKKMDSFTSFDLSGRSVTKFGLTQREATMVHIWKNGDASSIDTLKVLNEVDAKYDDSKFAVVGIVADLLSEDVLKQTVESVTQNGITFTNIAPSESVVNNVLAQVTEFPTTFIIDKSGTIIDVVDGQTTVEEYDALVSKHISK